jgi:hypothetical protein
MFNLCLGYLKIIKLIFFLRFNYMGKRSVSVELTGLGHLDGEACEEPAVYVCVETPEKVPSECAVLFS